MDKSVASFVVDTATKTVKITREFAVELPLVWDAFTNKEILDQWWAPKPYISSTKHMDFKVGGRRFYAMLSPDGQAVGWHIQDYKAIDPKTHFAFFSVFADEDEQAFLPGSDWDFRFSEADGHTKVQITIYNESLDRMEKMIEMGFKEGIIATLNELKTLLENK